MTHTPYIPIELGRRIFGDLPVRAFFRRYIEDVGDVTPELRRILKQPGVRRRDSTVWSLPGDYALLRDAIWRLSLFETKSRTDYQAHLTAWAAFARGAWISDIPLRAGVYPTRDKMGCRGVDRELREVSDRLIDVTKGFVGGGRTSEWRGDWWSEPLPPLPGAL